MISELVKELPDNHNLRKVCKAISVMDALLSPEPENRCHTYNAHWREGEELFESRYGEGNHLLILFREDGCIINGYCPESAQPALDKVTKGLPPAFNEFIFGEPVRSIGTTFCIWHYEKSGWQINNITGTDNCVKDMLSIFDVSATVYIHWANEYYAGNYNGDEIPARIARQIYNGEPLTKDMASSIAAHVRSWDLLQSDMEQIDYITDFKINETNGNS